MGKIELNIDAELLEHARAAGLDIQLLAERALRLALQGADPVRGDERARRWAEENADAIEEYNRRIAERGVFSDGLRNW